MLQPLFRDRRDAGRQLAEVLMDFDLADPVILCLPRGGVPVGFEIARALKAPMDILVVRKLGAPVQPELGMGAIAPGGIVLIDWGVVETLAVPWRDVDRAIAREQKEMKRRERAYRSGPAIDVKDRSVVLVDDGLATGVTARAAVRALRGMGARAIVLAVPVCARDSLEAMQEEVDHLVCLALPEPFRSVGYWYRDFEQTTDAEVLSLLAPARAGTDLAPAVHR